MKALGMALLRRPMLFGAYCLGVALANIDVVRALTYLSRQDHTYSHVLLIPPLTCALIYLRRGAIFTSIGPDRLGGTVIILAGVALVPGRLFFGDDNSLTFLVAAVVCLWLGGFLLFYGRKAFRAALFPLLCLGFMIPLPRILISQATGLLLSGSAQMVAVLFTLTGIPYHREEFVFSLPTFAIEIGNECSGIRSSIALVLTTLVAGHTFLKSNWKRTLLVLAVLPITILKNAIRIVCLSLLATYVDPGYLTGRLHRDGGIVFFVLAVAMLALILTPLRQSEMDQNPAESRA